MLQNQYEIIAGIVITIIIFLIAGFFIIILVAFINQRKKKHMKEKQEMLQNFKEEILQAQLEIQEQTMQNISQEIHDNIGQVLSLAKLHLATLDPGEDESMNRKISASKQLVGKAIQDLRSLSHNINTDYISETGLFGAVQYELDMISKTGSYETTLTMEGEVLKTSKEKELIFFRMIQEALNNIIKHAQAKKISVAIKYTETQVEIGIVDDGIGFDPNPGQNQGKFGIGIRNMQYRAKMIQADFNIQSAVGKGTQVTITLPLMQKNGRNE